jgi:cold shock CspA family protein
MTQVLERVAGVVDLFIENKHYGFVSMTEPFTEERVYLRGSMVTEHRVRTGQLVVTGASVILGDVVISPRGGYVATSIEWCNVQQSDIDEPRELRGRWFNGEQGIGFMSMALAGGALIDIFVHRTQLVEAKVFDLYPFEEFRCRAQVKRGPRGLRVAEILEVRK